MAMDAAVWGQCQEALQNLLKYVDRDKFAEGRDAIGAAHFAAAYAAVGEDGDFDALVDLIDEDLVAGIADEAGLDFAVRADSRGRTLVDRYLDERGARETPAGREFLRGLKASRVGVFEVLSGEDGSLELRDELEAGPTLRVADDPEMEPLKGGEVIGARLLPFRDRLCFAGGIWLLEPDSVDALKSAWSGEAAQELAADPDEELSAEELQAGLRDNLAAMLSNLVIQQELAWIESDDLPTS